MSKTIYTNEHRYLVRQLQKARKESAQEIMRITAEEDLPYIPLYITEFLGGVREDLEFSQRPDGSIDLADLSFAK